MSLLQAAKQALEALEYAYENGFITGIDGLKTIDKLQTLRQAIAQAEQQEPVARVTGYYGGRCVVEPLNRATVLPTDMALYAATVQQVDLTDDEIERALDAAKVPELPDGYKSVDLEIARAVIAADREKNK